ncbi:MAG: acyl-CoA dehydrogenase [Myxococcota bacterium]|nr:acyl-CoA dehydrogenase [Myxococcota bacterium]
MSATTFNIDLRDMRFVLHEQLRMGQTMSECETFADYDNELYDSFLDEAARFSTDVLAPCNRQGDIEGCEFDGAGSVRPPAAFKEAWHALAENGWMAFGAPAEHGGTPAPQVLSVAVHEMFTGANVAFATYPGLTRGVARLLTEFAPEWLKNLCIPHMYDGTWAGTMCLTEAGAGSAVGDNRARATRSEDGQTYLLQGEKVFITAGDQNFTENIIHLVLARTPDAPDGIKGLSIFAVPKFNFDRNGNLGARNGIYVTGIEEKMGIHGSVTCTLTLGENGPCTGFLLGEEGAGIQIMFRLMNEARIGVGIQGLSGAAGAYLNALSYAKERIQGVEIAKIKDFDAPRVPIVVHPDVRRMLMWQRVHVETMRSLLYSTAFTVDRAVHLANDTDREATIDHVGLITPLCKAHCSDISFEVCCYALQTYGGYGYLQDYPVEQYVRDTKIASIYEGTNGIQAMDLLGRKMRMQSGAVFMGWMAQLEEDLQRCRETGILDTEIQRMETARGHLGSAAMQLGGLGMQGDLDGAFLNASPFLKLFGTVALGKEAMIQARVAHGRLQDDPSEDDARFYRGKILNARFYAAHVLPECTALAERIQSGDTSCLEQDLFA